MRLLAAILMAAALAGCAMPSVAVKQERPPSGFDVVHFDDGWKVVIAEPMFDLPEETILRGVPVSQGFPTRESACLYAWDFKPVYKKQLIALMRP